MKIAILTIVTIFCAVAGAQTPRPFFTAAAKQTVGGGGSGDNIAFRAESHVIGTGTSPTVSEPTGAANNDVFIAVAICANSTTITAPTGWTVIYSGTASTFFKYNLAWIRRGSTAPSLTWTMGASAYREVFITAFSGCTTTGNPYETSADGGVTTGTGIDCPSVTTTTANDWVLALGANWAGSTSAWTPPSGYTLRSDNTAGNDGTIATKKVVSPGAENPAAYTGGSSSASQWQATIALKSS